MGEPFVCVVNLGCRVNRAESDRIVSEFARAGAAVVDADDADLIVINTCAVTGEAEAKTRKAVRHALARRRAPLVVAPGCAASLHPASLTEISERVTVVPSKADVVERSMELVGALGAKVAAASGAIDPALLGRSRLGVKVQDGCDNLCTYCIVL